MDDMQKDYRISVRVGRDLILLKKVCRMRGENVSDFVRRAIKIELVKLSFFTKEEKKALGLRQEEGEVKQD